MFSSSTIGMAPNDHALRADRLSRFAESASFSWRRACCWRDFRWCSSSRPIRFKLPIRSRKWATMVPAFARDVLGPSFVAFLTFKGIVCLGYFHPVVMGALVSVSLTLATIPVMEIETGFIDLVLARPVARHWIVTRSILVALISTVYLLAMMAIGTWIGLNYFAAKDAAWPSAGLIGSLAINLGFLHALLGSDCHGDRLRLPPKGFCWSHRGVAGVDGVPHRLHRPGVETGGIGRLAFAVSVLHAF